MSYGIVRIQKMTSGSVRGIDIHDNRLKEFSHTNPDIDFTKTENNYKLKNPENSFYNSVQERIKELHLPKAVRKDAVVMSQALVTSDKAFFDGLSKEQQDEFFKKSYEFIENRYGKENIISATVHLDEKTPHMHVNFVPVTSDKRLCAKDLLNRKEMQSLQNDAYKDVFKSFGLERGETRDDKRKHLTTEEFKISKKQEELDQKEKIAKISENKLNRRDGELTMRESRLGQKENKLNDREKNINQKEIQIGEKEDTLKRAVEGLNSRLGNYKDLNTMKPQKELLGGNYKLTGGQEELETILNLAKKGVSFDKMAVEHRQMENNLERAITEYSRIDKRLSELAREKTDLKEQNSDLARELKDKTKNLDVAKKVMKENGLENLFEKAVLKELQIAKKAIQMGMDRDR